MPSSSEQRSGDDRMCNITNQDADHLSDREPTMWAQMSEGERSLYRIGRADATLKCAGEFSDDRGPLVRAIAMLRDESDPVIAAAERLVQDAHGDDRLWAAVRPLREALQGVPTRLNERGELARKGSRSS